jgi:hypothetical protein
MPPRKPSLFLLRPYRAAASMMERFDVPDALIGDLVERRNSHSRLWFWWQAIGATASQIAKGIRQAKLTAVTAVLSAALLYGWFRASLAFYVWATELPLPSYLYSSRIYEVLWHGYCWPLNLAWGFGALSAGWLAARLNRRHAAAMVLVCALAQLPLDVWFGWPYLRSVLPLRLHGSVLMLDTHPPQPLFPELFAFYIGHLLATLFAFVGLPLCVLWAGLYPARRTTR